MGRKSKRGKKNGFWGLIGKFFSFLVIGVLKLIPLGLIAAAFLFGVFGVKKILCADTHLQVREIHVVPMGTLSAQSVKILEDKVIGKNIFSLDLKRLHLKSSLAPAPRVFEWYENCRLPCGLKSKKENQSPMYCFVKGGTMVWRLRMV